MAECCWGWSRIWLALILFSPGFAAETVPNAVDVASGRPAVHLPSAGGQQAGLAVDADEDTCSSANLSTNIMWTVDLGEQHDISQIYFQQGNGTNKQFSVDVHISSVAGKLGGVCQHSQRDRLLFQCYSPQRGRYISLVHQQTYERSLVLCEVNVYECNSGFYGNCSLECHCQNREACHRSTGKCPHGCAPGWMSDDCSTTCSPGTFGLECAKTCHCQHTEPCDSEIGSCSVGCEKDWFGSDCQTALPELSSPPRYVNSTTHSITLKWLSWTGSVGGEFELWYQLQYDAEGGSIKWEGGKTYIGHRPDVEDQVATVEGLQLNMLYQFRVKPLLKTKVPSSSNAIEGQPSSKSSYYRTECAAPEKPLILDVNTAADETDRPKAVITIKWVAPLKVHCDNILVYKIHYQRAGDEQPRVLTALHNATSKQITQLDFGTEYKVWVKAINNRWLTSESTPETVNTIDASAVDLRDSLTGAGPGAGVIAGVAVTIIVVIAIILFAVIVYRKRKAKYAAVPSKEDPEDSIKCNNMIKDDSGLGGEGSSGSTPIENSLEPVCENGRMSNLSSHEPTPTAIPTTPVEPALPPTPIERFPLKIVDLEEYVLRSKDNSNEMFNHEYREIPEGLQAEHGHGKNEENKHKNRFINIIAYNHSRVILDKQEGDPHSDYINASYIDGYTKEKEYIASQGCTKYTIQDMWRMVWQVDSHRIVMVTNLVENGKRKCESYWPDKENEEKLYGDVYVTTLDTESTSDFVIRTFNVRKDEENRNIKQFHFTSWPDHGVPNRASPIIAFRRKVRSYDQSHPGCITVHCSAGVGRTGTFIALDSLLYQAKAEGVVDVYHFTQKMRRTRVNMIQTVEQYIFVYDALLEALKAGNTAIACSEFKETYEALCQVMPDKGKSKLQEQYETLQLMSPRVKGEDCASGTQTENKGKNRFAEVLPADRYRPYLMTRVGGTNDYINAVFVDGYRSRNAYILSQMPLPHTVIDLWRMVYEFSCGSIVMLNPADPDDQTYGQYWPEENEECVCGPFVIESTSVDKSNPNITVRELRLQYQPQSPKKGETAEKTFRQVNQFQLHCWPKDTAIPTNPTNRNALIGLIDLVERSQLKTGNGPIVMHCHDGVRQSGLCAAVASTWEKMKVEQEVDIFQTVRQLRFQRPQIIQDMEQYQFCYEMVLAYLVEFEIYSNFR